MASSGHVQQIGGCAHAGSDRWGDEKGLIAALIPASSSEFRHISHSQQNHIEDAHVAISCSAAFLLPDSRAFLLPVPSCAHLSVEASAGALE